MYHRGVRLPPLFAICIYQVNFDYVQITLILYEENKLPGPNVGASFS